MVDSAWAGLVRFVVACFVQGTFDGRLVVPFAFGGSSSVAA